MLRGMEPDNKGRVAGWTNFCESEESSMNIQRRPQGHQGSSWRSTSLLWLRGNSNRGFHMRAGWQRFEQQAKKLSHSVFPVLEGDKVLLYAFYKETE